MVAFDKTNVQTLLHIPLWMYDNIDKGHHSQGLKLEIQPSEHPFEPILIIYVLNFQKSSKLAWICAYFLNI